MTPRVAYTVGYQGATPEEMAERLSAAGVTVVVDTRRNPTSRRPGFRRRALQTTLEGRGVRYESHPGLGVPRRVRPLARSRRWLFDAAYRGVLRRAERDIEQLVRLTASERIAFLCFEVDPRECHRSRLAAAIAERAPVLFRDISMGNREDPDNHPVSIDVMGPDDQKEFALG